MAFRALAVAIILLLAGMVLPAKEGAMEYYLDIDEDGSPVYTQVLTWEPVEFVRRYELTIRDQSGAVVHQANTETPREQFQLQPGEYEYRLTLYNLLNQPELQTQWYSFAIRRAVPPVVHAVQPEKLYLEDRRSRLTITGAGFQDGVVISLVDPAQRETHVELSIHSVSADTLIAELPERVVPGEYLVQITNPGGLREESLQPLAVLYQKPVSFGALVSWQPGRPVFDDWFTNVWSNDFYPAGAALQLELLPHKRWYGSFGVGLQLDASLMNGGRGTAEAKLLTASSELQAVYRRDISRRFGAAIRVGGGVVYSRIDITYQAGVQPQAITGLHPQLSSSAGLQVSLAVFQHMEAGIRLQSILITDSLLGVLRPYLGYGFFY